MALQVLLVEPLHQVELSLAVLRPETGGHGQVGDALRFDHGALVARRQETRRPGGRPARFTRDEDDEAG